MPLVSALMVAALVAGCGSLGQGWPWTRAEPKDDEAAVIPEPPTVEEESATALPAPVVPQPKPANLGMEPDDLIGLSQEEVLAFFGTPLRMIEESPAVRWQYEDGACALTLVFFPDLKTERFVTLQYKVEGGQEDDCLVRIARAQQEQ